VLKRVSFSRLLVAAFALSFIVGFAVFVLTGAATNRGTTGAIGTERTLIVSAERLRCERYGSFASIATLRKEGLLTFRPRYNSVVVVPGRHCGTIVVGSASYQSTSN
jgi:hypothetical protein